MRWVGPLLLVACGGMTSGTTNGTPKLVAACPSSPPAEGASCMTPIDCEYGTNFDFQCNTLAICDDTKKWTVEPPSCKQPNPGLGPGCPSSFSQASGACATPGTVCDFPEGRCGCVVISGPPIQDGGMGSPAWSCQQPLESGCPKTRPLNGEACSTGATCMYGAPCVEGSVMMTCSNGAWAGDLPIPCGGG